MANVTITQLPAAGPITGTESVPIVQNGQTVQTTTAAIAASPSQFQTFITLNQEPTLPASRALSGSTGVGLVDGGPLSSLQITLNGVSGSLESSGPGMLAKVGGTVVPRAFVASGSGLQVTDGNGIAGNPTVSLTGALLALAGLSGSGIISLVNSNSVTTSEILGTANQITVANGLGIGNPTISISTNPTLPGTGAVTIPKGTTAQRPGGVDGMIRFNTETSAYETYDTTGGWSTLPSGAVTQINTGTGLTGGPITTSGTISIANTTVAAGTYGAAGAVGRFTVNAQGQLTDAQSIPIAINPGQINPGILPPGVTVPIAQASINIANGLAGEIPVQTAPDTTSFIAAPTVANTYLEWDGSAFVWSTNPLGTVTSVDVDGGGTGLTFTGGPITTSGVITMDGILTSIHGGTGFNSYTNGQLLIGSSISGNLGRATLTGTTNRLIVTNGDSSITLDVDATSANTADKVVARDASGNFSAGTITADLTGTASTATNLAGGAAGSIPYQTGAGATSMLAAGSGVLVGGTTPSYTLTPSGLTSVTVTQNPTNALDLTTKQYVDGLVVSGVHFHAPVRVESPTNLNATYNNGVSGVGATLTNAGTQVALVIDGVTLSVSDRVLIYTQTNQTENGIYEVTDVGSISTNWVLTRTTDADTYGLASPTTLGEGSAVFVLQGDTGAGELYVCNTAGTITFGTTNITFVQIASSQIYSAGTGLTLTGTQFSVTTNGITDSLIRQSAGLSVIGRSANSTGNVADIVAASDYQVLRRSGTSIGFGAIDLSQSGAVTGTLPTGNGGTGLATYTAGDIVYYATGTALTALAIGTTNRILTSTGTAPTWTDPSTITVGTATNATDATNADNIAVASTSTNATFYPTFVDATSGDQAIEVDTDLTYNPSTNTLTVPNLVATTGISGGTF